MAREQRRLPHHGHAGPVRAAPAQAQAAAVRAARVWRTPSRRRCVTTTSAVPAVPAGLDLAGAPLLMGILNVTPDSFSDGGCYASADEAVAAALHMAEEGAALIDVGGESTRPGSDPVSRGGGDRRVLPVVQGPGRLAARPDLGRHLQGPGRGQGAGGGRLHDQRHLGPAHGPGDGRRGPRRRLPGDPHAHAGRAQDHAGRPRPTAMWSSDVYAFFVERLNWAVDQRPQGGEPAHRPGHRLRQDHRAQPGYPAGSGGVPVPGQADSGGRLAQAVPGGDTGHQTRPAERDDATAATTVMAVCAGAHVVRVHRGRRQSRRGACRRVGPSAYGRRKAIGGCDGHLHRRARGLRPSRGDADEEKVLGQRLLYDVRLTMEECPAAYHRRCRRHRRLHRGHRRHRGGGHRRELLAARAAGAGHGRSHHAQVPGRTRSGCR